MEVWHHPFIYWRTWISANAPLPAVQFFLFAVITISIAYFVFPKTVSAARRVCVQRFWKSLVAGILAVVVCTGLARILFDTEIGMPLAALFLGIEQFGLLFGIAVTSTLTASQLIRLVGRAARQSSPYGSREFRNIMEILLGALVVTLLNLVPGAGNLPPIGLRLVALLGTLGMGAACLHLRENKTN